MGVNCKGVTWVIHFGPPKSIETYLKESGQCGREGEQRDALLLYNAINVKVGDADMNSYIKSTACGRQFFLSTFVSLILTGLLDICVDICVFASARVAGHCDMDLQ